MLTTHSAGGVVLGPDGRVVVVYQRGGTWSLPKGHVDSGEDAEDAARREIAEESGIEELRFVAPLGGYERYRMGLRGVEDSSELKLITMFLFTTDEGRLSPQDHHNPEARWVEVDRVAELLSHPRDKAFFREVLPTIKRLSSAR